MSLGDNDFSILTPHNILKLDKTHVSTCMIDVLSWNWYFDAKYMVDEKLYANM